MYIYFFGDVKLTSVMTLRGDGMYALSNLTLPSEFVPFSQLKWKSFKEWIPYNGFISAKARETNLDSELIPLS